MSFHHHVVMKHDCINASSPLQQDLQKSPSQLQKEKCKFTVFKVMFDFDYPSPLLYIQLEIVSSVPVVRFMW